MLNIIQRSSLYPPTNKQFSWRDKSFDLYRIYIPCNRNLSSGVDSKSLDTPLSLSAGLGGNTAETEKIKHITQKSNKLN